MIPVCYWCAARPHAEIGVRPIKCIGGTDMSLAQRCLAAIHHPAATNCSPRAHSGPIIHTVSYAIWFRPDDRRRHHLQRGRPRRDGRPYRLRPAQRPRQRQARSCSSAGAGVQRAGYPRASTSFYAVAALFGFIYAGTMPLYAVLVREIPLRMMGTVIGGRDGRQPRHGDGPLAAV
jgi:hypothetical protein